MNTVVLDTVQDQQDTKSLYQKLDGAVKDNFRRPFRATCISCCIYQGNVQSSRMFCIGLSQIIAQPPLMSVLPTLCSFFQMLLSPGLATSTSTAFFSYFLITTISGWQATRILLVWSWKDLSLVVLKNLMSCGPFWSWNVPYLAYMFLYTLSVYKVDNYAVPSCILHPAVMCCTVSGAPLHSLQLGYCLVW